MKQLITISFLCFSAVLFAQEKPKKNETINPSTKENVNKKEAQAITSQPKTKKQHDAMKQGQVKPQTTKR